MKSQRAKDYIYENLLIVKGFDNLMLSPSDAARAVEIAEEDVLAAERLERSRKDFQFLTEMRGRLDNADPQYVREMMSDWIGELEREISAATK